jgi:hypothetical protein
MVNRKWEKIRRPLLSIWKKVKKEDPAEAKETDVSTSVELNPQTYEEIKKLAQLEQTTVTAMVHKAIEYYKTGNRMVDPPAIRMERKNNNPLLMLEGIAALPKPKMDKQRCEEAVGE